MKVTTDACLFGAWAAARYQHPGIDEHSKMPLRKKMLDIGTGTGLLSLMMTQRHPGLETLSIEIDPETAAEARKNISGSPWPDHIRVICADALHYEYEGTFDLIISNPPFYAKDLKGPDPKKNLAHHQEGLMLPDLLSLIGRLLSPSGQFFLLLPFRRLDEIRELAARYQLALIHITQVRARTGQQPIRVLLQGQAAGAEPVHCIQDELDIQVAEGAYSPPFIELLKEYYLYL